MQQIVIDELQNDTLNDALFSKGVELLARQMNRILDRLESMDINNFATQLARGFTTRLNQNSSNSFNSNIKNSVGLDLNRIVSTPELSDALNMAIINNTALIKSIKDEYKDNVSKLIRDNVFNGERPTNIVTQIKDIGGVTKSRAKLIARTETAKINADITQLRSEALGAKTYVWSASMDERTRTSHKVLDGLTMRFDDDTVYSDDGGLTWKPRSKIGGEQIKPGKIWNCRCVMLPVVSFS